MRKPVDNYIIILNTVFSKIMLGKFCGKVFRMLGNKKSIMAALLAVLVVVGIFILPISVNAEGISDEGFVYKYIGTDGNNKGESIQYHEVGAANGSSASAVMFKLRKDNSSIVDRAYCCDLDTYTKNNTYYKRTNLENAGYFEPNVAKRIRNVVVNGYDPNDEDSVIRLEKAANEWAQANKKGTVSSLTKKEALTATQLAVWSLANPDMEPGSNSSTITLVKDYLVNLPEGELKPDETVAEDIEATTNIKREYGTNKVTIYGTFSFYSKAGSSAIENDPSRVRVTPEGDAIRFSIRDENETLVSYNLSNMLETGMATLDPETLEYTYEIKGVEYDTVSKGLNINIKVSGVQELPKGAYFYQTPDRRDSQNFVGIADWDKALDLNAAVKANVYEPAKAVVYLDAAKTMDGIAPGEDNIFEFVLKDEKGEVVQKKVNTANGEIFFEPIYYAKEGIYNYSVSEVIKSGTTIVYDETVYEVSVDVTYDDEHYAFIAIPTIKKQGEDVEVQKMEFKNTSRGPAKLQITANKVFNNGELKDGQFSFVVKDKEGNMIDTAVNDIDGNIIFKEMSFDKVGVYEYTISEVKGTEDIKYDESIYTIKTKVYAPSNNIDQNLAVQVKMKKDDGEFGTYKSVEEMHIIFENTLIEAAKICLVAESKLDGKAPGPNNTFTFEITDESGEIIDTAQNDENGEIVFEEMEFDKTIDEYEFTVKQVKGKRRDISYDKKEYDIMVEVDANKDGTVFVATSSIISDEKESSIEFNNLSITAAASTDEVDTSDHTCIILWVMMLLTSLIIMILIFALSKIRINIA